MSTLEATPLGADPGPRFAPGASYGATADGRPATVFPRDGATCLVTTWAGIDRANASHIARRILAVAAAAAGVRRPTSYPSEEGISLQ